MTDDPRKTLDRIMSNPKVQAIGMSWYEEADYPEILALMADGDRLPATHADWLKKAQNGEQELVAKGARVVRAIVKPKAFAAWCAIRGLNIDAKARTRFASEEAARQLGLN